MANCLKCIHYNVCSALESGEDYINEDCDEYVEEANTNENNLLLIMAKGISKMCKETPCDKCMFYTQHQTEFTLFVMVCAVLTNILMSGLMMRRNKHD